MAVTHVRGHFQPFPCLVVRIDTGRVSLEIGVAHDAAIVEIAHACIVVESVFRSAYGKIVFLTEGIVESFPVPVVRLIVIFTVRISESGFRIQLEVPTDELFSVRNREYLIAQTAVVLVEKSSVCKCIGFLLTLAGIYL